MRVAALIKQIPAFEHMKLRADGRLQREGLDLEMNPYCRRAVAQAVDLARELDGDHSVTFLTLGPRHAEDVLREALAWAIARDVDAHGVLITDPAFAGSDTLATARALAAALKHLGPFDLVLVGRNSVDADTGQVGPEVAELLDFPFLTGVRHVDVQPATATVHARCEHDDGWLQAETSLSAVLSTAERLIEPCKAGPTEREAVPASMVLTLRATDLGPGPWGQAGSPTTVGAARVHRVSRECVFATGSVEAQVRSALDTLEARGALERSTREGASKTVPSMTHRRGCAITVVVEPDRPLAARELLGAAAFIASEVHGHVVALTFATEDAGRLSTWGADSVVHFDGAAIEDDAGRGLGDWVVEAEPWAVLAPSTAWGREVVGRAAARSGSGLIGDAVELEVDAERSRLVAWKPAFGGQLVAAVEATSRVQMVTVRVGVLPAPLPRQPSTPKVRTITGAARGRVRVLLRARDDDLDTLAAAHAVIGVGHGVDPSEYGALEGLRQILDAELGATRKVTDAGWQPRARQIGITGRSIAPRLYVSIGSSGKFNHMVGVRAAHTIMAINPDPDAPVFDVVDVGIVADWHSAVPALVAELHDRAGCTLPD